MKFLLAILASTQAQSLFGEDKSSVRNQESAYAAYLAKYGKVYTNKSEYNAHFLEFRATLRRIEEFNHEEVERRNSSNGVEGNTSFGLNSMSDWLPQQKKAIRAKPHFTKTRNAEIVGDSNDGKYPIYYKEFSTVGVNPVDWRTSGCVTKPRAQGNCGSCWAFSIAAAVEAYSCQAGGSAGYLSTQQLIDCSSGDYWGNAGCDGGVESLGYQYLMSSYTKLEKEDAYPYEEFQQRCRAPHG